MGSINADFAASAVSAGALLSTSTLEIPQFQREYAWTSDEYEEFWDDISRALTDDSYFLGLIILTGLGSGRKQVVDGQQRLLTVTLLACALYREAVGVGRIALADRISADFLKTVDFDTDEVAPRIVLADAVDNLTFQRIIDGEPVAQQTLTGEDALFSTRMNEAYVYLSGKLRTDLASDPFKRAGIWADFLTNRLQFAVFVHPDPASAYRVFEVINTRGRELTTADLLKNYLLSQTAPDQREAEYGRWQEISRALAPAGTNNLVQYIRHVVTVTAGHMPPKELFDYLARRNPRQTRPAAPSPREIIDSLERHLPLYLQMTDPTLAGPASPDMLKVFAALNDLGVIAVRPLLLAMAENQDAEEGMARVLNLVVRRIIVGNLGTGNVERRLGEAALTVHQDREWRTALSDLRDLDPRTEDFVGQLHRRGLNKNVLQFMRRSIVQKTKTPEPSGWLHYVRPRQGGDWDNFSDEDLSYWGPTIGNTILITQERRPSGAGTWEGVKRNLLPLAVEGESVEELRDQETWDAGTVETVGAQLAQAAAEIWY
jgi:hypothetical protein